MYRFKHGEQLLNDPSATGAMRLDRLPLWVVLTAAAFAPPLACAAEAHGMEAARLPRSGLLAHNAVLLRLLGWRDKCSSWRGGRRGL